MNSLYRVAWPLSVLVPLLASARTEGPVAPHAPSISSASSPDDAEKRGYWWKKESPASTEEGEFRELPPPPSEQELLALHPTQVEKLIEDYREYALWRMEPRTVQWYYELQDFARRRARAFMNVTEFVMLQNPQLNMQTVYPTNPVGQQARVAKRTNSIEQRLLAERGRAALVMLSSEGCEYCEAQRPILKLFQERYGWDVREIDIQREPELAARFGTDFTPTTVVIFRDNPQWQPVALGVETFERVEESAYRAVRYVRGEVDTDQYSLQEFQDGGLYDPRKDKP